MKKKIPFIVPSITEHDIEFMSSSILTGWLTYGPHANDAESRLASVVGAKYFLLTSSCTASLHMSLLMADVGQGDEVITTPMSWVATSNVILYVGAIPVFVDVDPETGLILPEMVEKAITKKTKAVIVVNLYGQLADTKGFDKLSEKHSIKIIYDSAHALDASRGDTKAGSAGFTSCYSFHAAKNLTCGQGGGISFNDQKLYEKARLLRRDGVNGSNQNRTMFSLGYKYDGTDFQAALICSQIDRIIKNRELRNAVLYRYIMGFQSVSSVSYQRIDTSGNHSAHMFVLWLKNGTNRDLLIDHLIERGIEVSVHYKPIHLEPYYLARFGFKEGDYPFAEQIGRGAISLPTYPNLSESDQTYIIESVLAALRTYVH